MTINLQPSKAHGVKNSWVNKNRILKLRLNRLRLGDALICSQSGWSVMCLVEDSSDALYVVYKDNVEMLRRKRADSLLNYLVNNTPDSLVDTLIFVEGGAINKIKAYSSDYTIDDYNNYDVEVRNIPSRKFVFLYLLSKDIFKKFQNVIEIVDIYRIFFPQASKQVV